MDYRARRRAVIAELKKFEWLRTKDIAAAVGVSRRTVRRDVAALRAQGISIEGRTGRGLRLNEVHLLDPIVLLSDEAAMMAVGCTVVAASLGKDEQVVAQDVRSRLMTAAKDQLRAEVEALEIQLSVVPGGLAHKARVHASLELIRQAFIHQKVVHFTLEGCTEEHVFCPYSLERIYGHWRVVGYNSTNESMCNYRVEALHGLITGEEEFQTPEAFSSALDHGLIESMAPVRIEFGAAASSQVMVAPPSFLSNIQRKDDGVVVTLEDVPEEAFLPWILGWGAQARVLSPPELIRTIARSAAETLQQYRGEEDATKSQLSIF